MYKPGRDDTKDVLKWLSKQNAQMQNAIKTSMSYVIGTVLYPSIDESKYEVLYSTIGSRPNIPVRKLICALVLERMNGYTDQQLILELRTRCGHAMFALHTVYDEIQPLSESTLARFRSRLLAYRLATGRDLLQETLEENAMELAKAMKLYPDKNVDDGVLKVRMDSMQVESHASVMTRLKLLYVTICMMLHFLVGVGMAALLPHELMHYLEKGDENEVLYYKAKEDKKAEVQDTRVETTLKEMGLLIDFVEKEAGNVMSEIEELKEWKLLKRVYDEQTKVNETGERVPKDKTEISAGSVQNPFDETVTYRNKRGSHHGSVLNVAEAYNDEGDGIIIKADLAPNTTSDQEFAAKYVDAQPKDGPKQVAVTDGGYDSEDLREKASEKNIDFHQTGLNGKEPDKILGDFVLDEAKESIITCPKGHKPEGCTYSEKTGIITAKMECNCCQECPYRESCKASVKVDNKRKKSVIKIKVKTVNRAKQSKAMSSEAGKALGRKRNGVEGIMSVMRRKYDLDDILYFRIERSAIWIWSSIICYNLVKYRNYDMKGGGSIIAS